MRLKGFSTSTFLLCFDRLMRSGEAAPAQTRWLAHGLSWTRERHSFYGLDHSITTEIVRASAAGPKSWTLMMVREGWWVGSGVDPIKTRQWAHLVKGERAKALADFGHLFDQLSRGDAPL